MLRHIAAPAPFRRDANDGAELITELEAGAELWMLDDTGGWAWGYGGPERRVGYVRTAALEA